MIARGDIINWISSYNIGLSLCPPNLDYVSPSKRDVILPPPSTQTNIKRSFLIQYLPRFRTCLDSSDYIDTSSTFA